MSKHNKWSKVKHKKGATDAQRGKLFTKLSRLITMAAQQGGGDLTTNASLRAAVAKAKSSSLPTDNIDRAIKKGTGELKEGARMESVTYEAFGPGGTAILIRCLTDNINRTIANIRTVLTKHGGHLGTSGSVSRMFQRKGIVVAGPITENHEVLELQLIDAGAEDIEWEGNTLHLLTAPESFEQCLKVLPINLVQNSEISMIPSEEKEIAAPAIQGQLETLISILEEDDDVADVFTNTRFSA